MNIRNHMSSMLKKPACTMLAVCMCVVIMVPNVALCVTESMKAVDILGNILLPLGFYMMVISAFRKTGWAVWAMLPFSILAAFQIVLLFLYGGSIIAVDMFLNVVTTNVSEATELLRNLGTAMVVVVVLYVPPLVWAAVSLWRKREMKREVRYIFRYIGLFFFISGISTVIIGTIITGRDISDNVFPVNVIRNIRIAIDRTVETEHYGDTSQAFSYNAVSVHDGDVDEFYVMVIGETSRAINWQLGGYGRSTNPRLSQRPNVVFYDKAISESNTTHKSVPMLLSNITACDFDSIKYVKCIVDAFRDAGFKTTFISNQAPNNSYTELFGRQADVVSYLDADSVGVHGFDADMLPLVAECLADTSSHKQFLVLHSYGSHFKYNERYPAQFGSFKPDVCEEVNKDNRDKLINAYDNTIEYTDMWLDSLMQMLEDSGRCAAIVYASDHGEDIMDDDRNRFLHASPTPTYYQLHVAMLAWVSKAYEELFPEKLAEMRNNRSRVVSSTSSLFNTMIDLGGLDTPYSDISRSVASSTYREPHLLYLNDKNEGVELECCGMKAEDLLALSMLNNL
ncbi:MAG: lipid A phosphoethanolamine transferase [Clostridiales bacterium]|nr:lipid A phosphoethanolamine transferase [Clostridiales bacterium]